MAPSAADGLGAYAQPVVYAETSVRGEYLKRVATYMLGGLTVASVTAVASATVLMVGPSILMSQWVSLGIILGMMFIAQNVAAGMVYSSESKLVGFGVGMVAQGIAMGYLLVGAVAVGAASYGTGGLGPLTIVFQAMALTMLTVVSMVGYLWQNPKDLSPIRGALTVMAVPMLVLMVVSFVFPIGGTMGIILSGLFVMVSAAGLFYQLNQVIHSMPAHAHVESAYTVTLGVLVLFWNILTTLMRLQSND